MAEYARSIYAGKGLMTLIELPDEQAAALTTKAAAQGLCLEISLSASAFLSLYHELTAEHQN
jgi:hypothetical protein